MSLRIWLPLMGNLNNQGLSNITATNNGATVDTNGKIGSCYSFDGSDDYISLVYSDFPTILNESFTICFWFYNNDSGDRAIFFGNYGLTGSYFNFEKTNAEKVRFYWSSHPDTYTTNLTIPTSVWSHIAVTRDGNIVKFYLNGVLKDTSTTEITGNVPSSANTFYLGRDNRTGATALNGKLNDFRLYDHALSIKEIKEISKGLVCHYALDGKGAGGNNLAIGTNTNNINTNKFRYSQQNGGSTCTIEYDDGTPCLKITRNTTEFSGWAYFSYQNLSSTEIKESTTYTVSFDMISSGSGNITFTGFLNGNATNYLTNSTTVIQGTFNSTSWSHIVLQATTKDSFEGVTIGAQQVYMGCSYMNATEVWIMMKNMKVEEGVKDTPWSPHKNDAKYTSMGYGSLIENDLSGFGHNGTIKSAFPIISTDSPRYNASYQYEGSVNNACVNTTTDLNFTDNFTWSMWIKPKYTGTSTQYAFTVGRADYGEYGYGLRIASTSSANIRYGNRGYNVASVEDDTWTHIAFTKSGTLIKIYKDGVVQSDITFDGSDPTYGDGNGVGVGCFHYTGDIYPYYGKISDFRIYATALSENDIKELYNIPVTISDNGDLFTQGEVSENSIGVKINSTGVINTEGSANPNMVSGTNRGEVSSSGKKVSDGMLCYGSGGNGACTVSTDNTVPVGKYSYDITGNTSGNRDFQQRNVAYKADKQYTGSWWAKGSGTCLYRVWDITDSKQLMSKTFTLTNEWAFYSHTFTATQEMEEDNCTFHLGLTGNSEIHLCEMKLEESDHPTPWMYNEYDIGFTENGGFVEDESPTINELNFITTNEIIET